MGDGSDTVSKTGMFHAAVLRARAAPLNATFYLNSPTIFQFGTREAVEKTNLLHSGILRRSIVTVAQTSRLTGLTLHLLYYDDILKLPPGLFPSLERLTLNMEFVNDVLQGAAPVRAFEDAPSLRRVALGTWELASQSDHHLRHLQLPLHQLTHYVDSGAGGFTIALPFLPHFFEKCTSVEYLATKLDRFQVGPPERLLRLRGPASPFTRQISSSTLKVLTLSFWGGIGGEYDDAKLAYPEFMDFVDLPQLEGLVIDCADFSFDDNEAWSPLQVIKFHTKLSSLRHLRYLSITCHEIHGPSLATLLRSTPHVTQLDLHSYRTLDTALEVLNRDNAAYADILPNLDTLVLELGEMHASGDYIFEGRSISIDPDFFQENIIIPRVTRGDHSNGHPESQNLRKIIAYGRSEKRLENTVPFIRFMNACESDGIVEFEGRLAENRSAVHWIDRDPHLADWPDVHASNWIM